MIPLTGGKTKIRFSSQLIEIQPDQNAAEVKRFREAGLRIFGAGIMSSIAESVFALENPSPHRVAFNLERVMRTNYIIDDFQQTYFVVDSFQSLLDECYRDFGPVYARIGSANDVDPDELVEGDKVVSRGTLAYFRDKADKA
jgi:phenylalanine-4-hydroxylase